MFRDLDLEAFDDIAIMTHSTTGGTSFLVERYWVNLSLVAEVRVCPMANCHVFATDSWLPGEGVEALIGMDILNKCFFQLMGPDRRFTLSF